MKFLKTVAYSFSFSLIVGLSFNISFGKTYFAAIGDVPYNDITATPPLLKVFDEIGASPNKIPFVIHVGDIWRRCVPCTAERYVGREELFEISPVPLIIVPGDNEFTDCPEDKSIFNDPEGFKDRKVECNCELHSQMGEPTDLLYWRISLDRYVKNLLQISKPSVDDVYTIRGRRPASSLKVKRMKTRLENVKWSYMNVGFIGVNLPGQKNEKILLPRKGTNTIALKKDETGEKEADLEGQRAFLQENTTFIKEAFREFKDLDAIVVFFHTDPQPPPLDHVKPAIAPFLTMLTNQVTIFDKPVLLIHGDGHQFFLKEKYQGAKKWWRLQVSDRGWTEVVFRPMLKKFEAVQHYPR